MTPNATATNTLYSEVMARSSRYPTNLGRQIYWYFVICKYGRAYHYAQSRDEELKFRLEMGWPLGEEI